MMVKDAVTINVRDYNNDSCFLCKENVYMVLGSILGTSHVWLLKAPSR